MKRMATIIIIIGIAITAIPPIGQLYTLHREKQMISEYLESPETTNINPINSIATPEESYKQLEEAFKEEISALPAPTPATMPPKTPEPSKVQNSNNILGIMRIDKIKVNVPIIEGTQPENLNSGIGHIPGTAQVGQPGNCALAGHRSYTFGQFFNRLDELGEGDEIQISTKKTEYKYKVFKKYIINPDDLSILKGGKENTIITLITCTPIFIASHRLIVQAKLENQK